VGDPATLRPPATDHRRFPLLGHVEHFILTASHLRPAEVATIDDEPQLPSELM
jgi:hypothetical protein